MDYRYILSLTDQQLASADIADMNLRFAEGLPGAEHLDRREALHKIDKIARKVKQFTEARRLNFVNFPERCGGTLGRFRMMCLVTVLQRDLGIHYQRDLLAGEYDARDSPRGLHQTIGAHGSPARKNPAVRIRQGEREGKSDFASGDKA